MTDLTHKVRASLQVLDDAIHHRFPGEVALVSSFGADAAVLLHLAATIERSVPVLFIDTRRHFAETLAYQEHLTRFLGLTHVQSVTPDPGHLHMRDPDDTRAAWDPDGCCDLRKVVPLQAALLPFRAWITGRKRYQTAERQEMHIVEQDGTRTRLNPLADWSASDVIRYARDSALPPHPLVARGYPSIGCAPCTIPAQAGAPRAGRWAGTSKTECGLHTRPFPETQP